MVRPLRRAADGPEGDLVAGRDAGRAPPARRAGWPASPAATASPVPAISKATSTPCADGSRRGRPGPGPPPASRAGRRAEGGWRAGPPVRQRVERRRPWPARPPAATWVSEEPDRAAADDRRRSRRAGHGPRSSAVDGDAERLQHRPAGVADAVRQGGAADSVRPGHELAHGRRRWPPWPGEAGRSGAEIAVAVGGSCHRYRTSWAGSIATRLARAGDRPSITPAGLVAEHQRGRQGRVADPALVPPVQVGAADADRGHPHQCTSPARAPGPAPRSAGYRPLRATARPSCAPCPFLVPASSPFLASRPA